MSNAAAGFYAYLAQVDRDRARVFRNFGYHASADYVERRAASYERRSKLEALSKEAPQDEPCGASRASHSTESSQDDDLHTTSVGQQQTGLFAQQEPPL